MTGGGAAPSASRRDRLARDLLTVRPHGDAHWVALRAGICVLVPLLVLWATGHLTWSIFAVFGAMTSLYGRNRVHVPGLQLQVQVGVLLTLVTAGGVLVGTSEHRAWLAVPLAALLASGAALLSDVQDWHPPGALFPVFAFTACASLPAQPRDVPVALAVAAAAAAFAVVVGNLGAFWRARRRPRDRDGRTPWRRGDWAASLGWHVLPSGLAVLVAGSVATGVGIGHPYWAMVSAVVPLVAREFRDQLVRGLHRLVGTALGLAVAAVVLAVDPPALALIALVTLLQVGAELLIGRNYALALTCVTPLALLMVYLVAGGDRQALLLDQGLETVIGVAVGLVVGYLTRAGVGQPPVR
ncbi:FUSC family protein [Nocardioides pantholopis]|uniref:FUSC family protein n=1 Tax=Nocardioides pantholopis TaxID=2483798 RepID=UPI001F494D5C|nr:FUSC family protein [Nocardioides pantholopis]